MDSVFEIILPSSSTWAQLSIDVREALDTERQISENFVIYSAVPQTTGLDSCSIAQRSLYTTSPLA